MISKDIARGFISTSLFVNQIVLGSWLCLAIYLLVILLVRIFVSFRTDNVQAI